MDIENGGSTMQNIFTIHRNVVARNMLVPLPDVEHDQAVGLENARRSRCAIPDEQQGLVIADVFMREKEKSDNLYDIRDAYRDAKIIAISGSRRVGHANFLRVVRQSRITDVIAKPLDPGPFSGIAPERSAAAWFIEWQDPSMASAHFYWLRRHHRKRLSKLGAQSPKLMRERHGPLDRRQRLTLERCR